MLGPKAARRGWKLFILSGCTKRINDRTPPPFASVQLPNQLNQDSHLLIGGIRQEINPDMKRFGIVLIAKNPIKANRTHRDRDRIKRLLFLRRRRNLQMQDIGRIILGGIKQVRTADTDLLNANPGPIQRNIKDFSRQRRRNRFSMSALPQNKRG